jgi:hypothetical protein
VRADLADGGVLQRPRSEDTVDVGGQLRFFGDGYQASKVLDGRRYWRVPVMEGEFLVQERFGVVEGVAGGNIIMLGRDAESALRAAEAAASAMRGVEGVIMPFPGGIARSGSKVGSRYRRAARVDQRRAVPDAARTGRPDRRAEGRRGGVRDRDRRARAGAGARGDARGLEAAAGGRARITPATTAATSARTTSLKELCRDADAHAARAAGGRSTPRRSPRPARRAEPREIGRLGSGTATGARPSASCSRSGGGRRRRVEGDLSGELASAGSRRRLTIAGASARTRRRDARRRDRRRGRRGRLRRRGMRGGPLVVRGSAGRRLGGAYAGERAGMRGGEILVHGDAGEEAGAGCAAGSIAVAGRTGDAAGLSALAARSSRFGALGAHPGAGMRRASIVAHDGAAAAADLRAACTYRPPFLRLCLRRLRALGLPVTDAQIEGRYTRWSGDGLELRRGEILILEAR